ncbi:hypothetical protein M0805_008016 [Coniferiporia weirii]|nr:hypothetical protein M0805_008016 [Coniferiporia weirii]
MSSIAGFASLDGGLGCLLLGGIFWGAGSVQLYSYYDNFSDADRWWLKLHVFLLYVFDTVHQAFLLVSLYSYFVTNFRLIDNLTIFERTLLDTTIYAAFVSVLAQSLFIKRIWHLSKGNYILTGTLVVLVTGQFVATAVYYKQTFDNPGDAQIATVGTSELAMNSISAFVDVSIASILTILLHSLRSGIKRTDALITRLILYIVTTSLATGALAVVALITFILACPGSLIYWTFNLIIPKLYLNSALALLNSRQKSHTGLTGNAESEAGAVIRFAQPVTNSGNTLLPYATNTA